MHWIRGVILTIFATCLVTVHGQGFLWAFSSKKSWFLERAFEEFPPGLGGKSPYSNLTISAACHLQLIIYASALNPAINTHQDWAVKMFDSDPQVPPGIYNGNYDWLGSYDTCRRVKATYQKVVISKDLVLEHNFDAKYCRSLYRADNVSWSLATCVPDACSHQDIQNILSLNATDKPAFPIIYSDCGQDRQKFDSSSIACAVLLSLLCLPLVVGTLYDIIVQSRQTPPTKVKAGGGSADLEARNGTSNSHEHTPNPEKANKADGAEAANPRELQTTPGNQEAPNKPVHRWQKALLAFSLYSNIPSILSTKTPPGAFKCFYAVRFFSMAWIILGHTWQLGITVKGEWAGVADNLGAMSVDHSAIWTREVIDRMSVAVESFFVLSGALVTMSFLRALEKQNGRVTCKQMGLYYFHRYWRLTPVLAVLTIFVAGFYNLFVDGPLVSFDQSEGRICRSNWWTTIFYINNLVPPYHTCMGWTWYLANDFQFYIIAPGFICLLAKHRKAGIAVLTVAIVLSIMISGGLMALVLNGHLDMYGEHYIKPWVRFNTYGIGIMLGYVMHRTKCQTKIPLGYAMLGWVLASVLCLLSVFGDIGRGNCSWCSPLPGAARLMYETLFRPMFALGIAWLVFACCCNAGGFMNTFLSWRGFVPLGKLTYTCYLMHPLVLYYAWYTRGTQLTIIPSTMTFYFAGVLLISYLLSLLVSAAFEVSMLLLEKAILPRH